MLKLTCENKIISISVDGHQLPDFALTPSNIYALDQLLTAPDTKMMLSEGIDIRIPGPIADEDYSLHMELLRQVIYLHTTYCIYPKISSKSPSRGAHACEDFEHYFNSLKNIPVFKKLCQCQILRNYVKGAPVAIVSPGPSMDLELLRRIKGRVYIVAIGRALPKLISNGITPDFLYVQDTSAQAWQDIFDFNGCPDVIDTVLISNPVGYIHKYSHKVRHVYKAWNYYPFEKDIMLKIDEIPPSSTSGAFSVALMLGAGELVFIGNDSGGPGEPNIHPKAPRYNLDEILRNGFLPESMFHKVAHFTLETPQGLFWTSCDYIAGSQWLKTRLYNLILQSGMNVYDNSSTGFLRDTGQVKPLPDNYSAPHYDKGPLPVYEPQFHPERHIKTELGRFAMIKRSILKNSPLPPIGLTRPYNCIFQGIPRYDGSSLILTHDEKIKVLEKMDLLTDQFETLLAVDW